MSNDGQNADFVGGGFGDDFAFVDSGEVKLDSLEHITFVGPVGSLRMAPRVLKATTLIIMLVALNAIGIRSPRSHQCC